VTLPGAYASASIALGVIRARKTPHPQHVLRQVVVEELSDTMKNLIQDSTRVYLRAENRIRGALNTESAIEAEGRYFFCIH